MSGISDMTVNSDAVQMAIMASLEAERERRAAEARRAAEEARRAAAEQARRVRFEAERARLVRNMEAARRDRVAAEERRAAAVPAGLPSETVQMMWAMGASEAAAPKNLLADAIYEAKLVPRGPFDVVSGGIGKNVECTYRDGSVVVNGSVLRAPRGARGHGQAGESQTSNSCFVIALWHENMRHFEKTGIMSPYHLALLLSAADCGPTGQMYEVARIAQVAQVLGVRIMVNTPDASDRAITILGRGEVQLRVELVMSKRHFLSGLEVRRGPVRWDD